MMMTVMIRVWKDCEENRSTRSFRARWRKGTERRRIWDANRVKIWWGEKRRRGTNGRTKSWRNLRDERVEFVEGGTRITIRNNPPPPWRTCTSNRCIRWRRPHRRTGSAYNAWLFTNLAHPRLDNHLSQRISIRSWLPSGSGLNMVSDRVNEYLASTESRLHAYVLDIYLIITSKGRY